MLRLADVSASQILMVAKRALSLVGHTKFWGIQALGNSLGGRNKFKRIKARIQSLHLASTCRSGHVHIISTRSISWAFPQAIPRLFLPETEGPLYRPRRGETQGKFWVYVRSSFRNPHSHCAQR